MSTELDHIVFVHGWGCGPDFWDDMAALFPQARISRVNLGFCGGVETELSDGPAVYITHSLGTMWALKHASARMRALIAINGFGCFKPFSTDEVLYSMAEGVRTRPAQQMKAFLRSADIRSYVDADAWNVPALEQGLENLSSWDERTILKDLSCPVLSLAGERDRICDVDVMREAWCGYDLRVCEDAGHGLPQSHPQWCAQHVQEFLS